MDKLATSLRNYMEAECGWTDNTVQAHMRDASQFLEFAKNRPFSAVLAEEWLSTLRATNHKPSTIARKRISVMTLYRVYSRQHRLDEDTLLCIDPVRRVKENLPVLTAEQIEELVQGIRGPCDIRNIAIVRLMFETAIRVSECVGLTINDIKEGRDHIRIMAKGRRERVVRISAECLRALLDYANRWRTRYAQSSPALFIGLDGAPLSRYAVSHMLSYFTEKLSLPHASSHTLRRSRATSLMNAGVDIEDVQKHLGHQDIGATQQYLRLSHERLRAVYNRCHPSCNMEDR